jgi:hypothetical protein
MIHIPKIPAIKKSLLLLALFLTFTSAAIVKKLNPKVFHIHLADGRHSTTYQDAVTILESICSPNAK